MASTIPSTVDPAGPTREEILRELETILTSPLFRSSERPSRFLRFAVESTLAGEAERLKEYSVGTEVFGRRSTFDPRTDPIVRVEARRLRSRLLEYYEKYGGNDPILIELPKGAYVPAFRLMSEAAAAPRVERAQTGRWMWALPVALAAVCPLVYWLGFDRGEASGRGAVPVYQRLTFRRGNISRARFTADGQTVVYAATGAGRSNELFASRLDSSEPRALEIDAIDIEAISNAGEMIVARPNRVLARMPLSGGAPRDFAAPAMLADWAPDGRSAAVAIEEHGKNRIEYPAGKTLLELPDLAREMRFSPKGDQLALTEGLPNAAQEGLISVVDLHGRRRVLTAGLRRPGGLAWTPDGKEIWFSARRAGAPQAIYAVDLSGRSRLVARAPGALVIQDISRDGSVLVEHDTQRVSLMCLSAGRQEERDLSWLDDPVINQISTDGKTLLFTEAGEGGGESAIIYLRGVDGSPAVRLGEGRAKALSPDGKWVVAAQGTPAQLVLLPTGPGATRLLEPGDQQLTIGKAAWFPSGDRILFQARQLGHDWQLFVQNVAGGQPRAISPVGTAFGPLSPDGKSVAIAAPGGGIALFGLDGGPLRQVPMAEPGWRPVNWTADGRSLFVYKTRNDRIRVERVNVATGQAQFWKEIAPVDWDELGPIQGIEITPDGKTYAYSYSRTLSTLYLIKGLR